MNLDKFDQYLADRKKNIDESKDEKKEAMYRDGCYSLRSAFNEFSQYYMKAMGMLAQNKTPMTSKYKKLRDSISMAYERMDDAISKHNEQINKDYELKVKATRG